MVVVVVGKQRRQEASTLPLTTHFGIGTPHIFTVRNMGPTADHTGRFSPLGDTEGLLCVEESPALGPTDNEYAPKPFIPSAFWGPPSWLPVTGHVSLKSVG